MRSSIRRGLLVAGSVPVLALAAPGLAQAASGHPHFINNATSASQSGSTLTVAFKEAGLPSGATETVTTSATASTTYECVNGGGKNPSASNKHSYTTTVAKSGTFTADRNGNIVGSETLSPPSAASVGFSCPSGQTVTFVGVSYTNVQITDTTSGASTNFGGAYSYTNPNAPAVR